MSPTALAASVLIITVDESTLTSSPTSHDRSFALTDTNGVTTSFKINNNSGSPASNSSSYSPSGEKTLVTTGLLSRTDMQGAIITKINAMGPASFTAIASGDNVLVTQNTPGASGNTEITFPSGSIHFEFQSTVPGSGIDVFSLGTDTPLERFDNAHYNSLLPASDFQYSWINAAISGSNSQSSTAQRVIGYAPKSGIMSSSVGFDSAINFPTISDISCCILGVLEIFVDYKTSEGVAYAAPDGSTVEVMQFNNANEEGEVYQHDTDDIEIRANYTGCCTEALQYRVQLTAKVDGGTVGTYDSGFTTSNKPLPATSPSSSSTGAIIYDSGSGDRQVTAVFTVKDCEGNEKSTTVIFDNAKLAS